MEIIKRDGRKESFDSIKISNAIRKALISVGEKDADSLSINLTRIVEERLTDKSEWSVELIQDIVEETLMAQGQFAAAKNSIPSKTNNLKRREGTARSFLLL